MQCGSGRLPAAKDFLSLLRRGSPSSKLSEHHFDSWNGERTMVETANSIFKAMLVTIEVASKGTPWAIKNPERCLLWWIPEVVALHIQSATHVLHHAGMHGAKRMKSQKPRGTPRLNRPATDSTSTASGEKSGISCRRRNTMDHVSRLQKLVHDPCRVGRSDAAAEREGARQAQLHLLHIRQDHSDDMKCWRSRWASVFQH